MSSCLHIWKRLLQGKSTVKNWKGLDRRDSCHLNNERPKHTWSQETPVPNLTLVTVTLCVSPVLCSFIPLSLEVSFSAPYNTN